MTKFIRVSALVAAASVMAVAGSAGAAPQFGTSQSARAANGMEQAWQHGRDREWRGDYRRGASQRVYHDEPVYRNTRVWRGRDGRAYCRKKDGTVGLIVGGAVGALVGRQLDGGYDRSLGTILGAAGGALLGREVARGGGRCR